MSDDEDESPVDNQYKLALGDDLPRIRGQASICTFAYNAVRDAFDNGAWDSTAAREFFTALTDHISKAATEGEDCEQAFENRHQNEPDTVPPDHPYARWTPPSPPHSGPNGPM